MGHARKVPCLAAAAKNRGTGGIERLDEDGRFRRAVDIAQEDARAVFAWGDAQDGARAQGAERGGETGFVPHDGGEAVGFRRVQGGKEGGGGQKDGQNVEKE